MSCPSQAESLAMYGAHVVLAFWLTLHTQGALAPMLGRNGTRRELARIASHADWFALTWSSYDPGSDPDLDEASQ